MNDWSTQSRPASHKWARPWTGRRRCSATGGEAVISGLDPENDNEPYVNQLFVAYGGGPAKHGTDGWLTYLGPVNGGVIVLDSVEIDEGMYPILIESRKVALDTMGAG